MDREATLAYASRMVGKDIPRTTVIRRPKGGPVILEGALPDRPVSLMDLTVLSASGNLPDMRVVPRDRDYHLFPRCSPLTLVSPLDLYEETFGKAHYALPYDGATEIKHRYWSGQGGIRSMAREYGIPIKTVYRLVHSLTYWYLW